MEFSCSFELTWLYNFDESIVEAKDMCFHALSSLHGYITKRKLSKIRKKSSFHALSSLHGYITGAYYGDYQKLNSFSCSFELTWLYN